MGTAHDVPFLRTPGAADGFESTTGTDSGATAQRARATDLFLRGAITPEQLAVATASSDGFESLIGDPNFLPAVFLELGAAAARCTCLVRTSGTDFDGRPGAWNGTGFLIGPNVVLTNHHVLNSPAVAEAAECVFDYQTGADGRPATARTFRLRPDRLFLTSPARGGLDYTFCWVDGDPGRAFGAARVDRRAFAIAPREFANVIAHPDGRMKEVCVHDNKVLWQDDLVVHYTSDTERGSSGASVCNNSWQLVALHHASRPSHVPEHRFLNEGIKLSAIAADLERLAGAASGAAARELLGLFGGTDERLGFFGALGRPDPAGTGLEAVVNTFKGTEQDLDVGFWNVEWLTKHHATKAPAVAKLMREMHLDVWCLEESSPAAAEAVAKELKDTYDLDFGHAAAEPASTDGKQSCTLLWNTVTVTVTREEWGEPVESWLKAKSTDFADLGLGGFEAVHGKIFDRYPALFKVTAKQPAAGGAVLAFYLVPVHLKAMAEGSLRRRMASKILAAAVEKKSAAAPGIDFMIGGDANAELGTGDFANLTDGGLVAASAADEAAGAFSYVKGPKSLIDHIFLSPNLADRSGADGFFIVAADKTIPGYVSDVSDHRPVLVRLSLNGGLEAATTKKPAGKGDKGDKLAELKERLSDVFERGRKKKKKTPAGGSGGGGSPAGGLGGRTGYAADFLGEGKHRVPLPALPAALAADAAVVSKQASGTERFALHYTHFTVVQNAKRRLPFYSAVNIDGTQLRRVARENTWFLDPRIPDAAQVGNEAYKNNDLDRGHMTRRLDPVWGTPAAAEASNADTFCYTNSCPQHKDLNQKEWNDLEDYVLDSAGAHGLRVSVFTGPVLRPDDQMYRGIVRLPKEFWKVVVIVKDDTDELSATGYLLSQREMIEGFEAGFAGFGPFRTYQVTIRELAGLTGLDFGALPEFDPKDPGGLESAARPALVTGPDSLVL